jgi:heptosyltransferase-2
LNDSVEKPVPASRILIVGPSWVGDMVMAQSLFYALKVQDQQCRIDVIAPPWSVALVDNMPEVDTAIELPIGHGELALLKRHQIGVGLRDQDYQRAIVLPGSWKSALIPYFAAIPWRTGYVGECRWGLLSDARKLDKSRLKRTVDRFVGLAAEKAGAELPAYKPPALQANQNQARQLLQRFHVDQNQKPVLALCPGAEYGSAKQWPEQHYANLAQHFFSQGWNVWLFGSANDQSVCRSIKQLANIDCINFSGQTSLSEAIDLLSIATAVVSNDSGLMHIAAALNIPMVAVYGSSDPVATPPLSENVRVVSLNLPCSPCFKRECPYGHRHCLTQIEPQLVIDQLTSLCEF